MSEALSQRNRAADSINEAIRHPQYASKNTAERNKAIIAALDSGKSIIESSKLRYSKPNW